MSSELIMVLILGCGLLAVAVFIGQQRSKKLEDEGKIVKRDASFIESAEVFTLSGGDFADLVPALEKMNLSGTGASWESKGATRTVYFKSGHGWAAQLQALESDSEKSRYSFQFTNWQTRKGMPWRVDTMNMLLTSVEKAFLSLDPSTQVETTRIKTKSKPSFF